MSSTVKNLKKTLLLNTINIYNNKRKQLKQNIPKLSKHIYTNIHKYLKSPNNVSFNHNNMSVNYFTYNITALRQKTCKRINSADINSLYPFSFINRLPFNNHKKNVTNHTLKYSTAIITKPNFERIPFQNIYTQIYTNTHLNYLKKLNYNIKITHTTQTNYSNNIITDFILHTYKTKQNNQRKITKLLLNSSYGKIMLNDYNNKNKNQTNLLTQTMLIYSIIYIHKKANIPHNPPCYSDTDSLYVRHAFKFNKKEKLGKFKNQTLDTIKVNTLRNYLYKTNNNKTTTIKGIYTNIHKQNNLLPKNFVYIQNLFIIQTFIYQVCLNIHTNIYTQIYTNTWPKNETYKIIYLQIFDPGQYSLICTIYTTT
nr:replication helicase subunit [Cassiopea sp. MKL-2023]